MGASVEVLSDTKRPSWPYGAIDAGRIHFSNPGKPGCGVVWNPESTIQNMESSDIVDGYRGECWGIMKKMVRS